MKKALVAMTLVVLAIVLLGCGPGVPDVKGMTVTRAEDTLKAAGLTLGAITESYDATAPAGTVVAQTPAAGADTSRASSVSIVVSKGREPVDVPPVVAATIEVPDLFGKSYDDAESVLKKLGLGYEEKINADGPGPKGGVGVAEVFRQSPAAGALVTEGATVTIWFQIYE